MQDPRSAATSRTKLLDECDYPLSLIPLVEEHAAGKRILEVGCGASQLLPMLQERGFQVEGFEGDPAGLRLARERTLLSGPATGMRSRISLRGRQFDCIVSDQVFEHTLRPGHFLSQLRDSLLPKGSWSSDYRTTVACVGISKSHSPDSRGAITLDLISLTFGTISIHGRSGFALRAACFCRSCTRTLNRVTWWLRGLSMSSVAAFVFGAFNCPFERLALVADDCTLW
jgi:SAM-dependent methyltransferase